MPAAIYRAPLFPPPLPFLPFSLSYFSALWGTGTFHFAQFTSVSFSLLCFVFSREVDRSSFKICRRLLLINSSSFIVITLFRPTPYIHSNRSAIGLAYAVRCVTYCVLVCLRA